ncbi:MAG: hypothetical protein Q9173_003196 [Seirophora scorigena]
MANYLASIFGTEQDKVTLTLFLLLSPASSIRTPSISRAKLIPRSQVNCSFYYKIGACRHGDRCSRKHVKPSYSQTILLPNLYQNPAYDPKNKMNASQLQNHFDAFYEDFWCEMCKYGEVEEVVVCDNNNDRMSCSLSSLLLLLCPLATEEKTTSADPKSTTTDLIGNVYARFKYEDSAQQACDALNSRWYAARPIYCELSPVTDFREACCRLNSGEGCVRGGFCNFIHRKEPSPELDRELELGMKKWLKTRGRDDRSASRSPSPEPTRKRY